MNMLENLSPLSVVASPRTMKHPRTPWWITAAIFLVACACGRGAEIRELKVHLAQANNESGYAFVRAKFLPGEITDPWAVRFLDGHGAEVPHFVWDSVTWRVAREGREDWGRRFALLNHAAGDAPETRAARGEKLVWAKTFLGALGDRMEVEDSAAKRNGDSICAAMYLLKRSVPAMGKERLTLRIDPERKDGPKRHKVAGMGVAERVGTQQGELRLDGLPDQLRVSWRGREVFRSAGFDAGGSSATVSHADPARTFTMEITEGIVTKVALTGQTARRDDGATDWQCTYWLFPEGGCVALEGFSLTKPGQYLGGPQQLSRFAAADGAAFAETHKPDWDRPWWIHSAGGAFVATHLFMATPLTIGYGNNPGTVNAEGPNKEPRADVDGGRLALRWFHEANDPAITRLSSRQTVTIKNGHIAAADDPAMKPAWQPRTDWVYRQYALGVGDKAEGAERALRHALGAAAGWIDRPFSEEEIAAQLVAMMSRIGVAGQSAEIGLLKIVPAVMADDKAAIQSALRDRMADVVARSDQYIGQLRANVANGGHPAAGSKLMPDGSRVEGWTGNPCYHAALMPTYLRVFEFLDQPYGFDKARDALLRYADAGLELMGGTPVDFEKLRTTLESQWPSRVVPTIPLMLHADSLRHDDKYFRTAKMLFDDLLRLTERNPHGYFPAWTWMPGADKYDTVYNPVSYDRGITSVWYEGAQDRIGREAASRFTAAQARWLVFSGQLLDSLETDSVTAIRACNHGGHTNLRNQIGLYLYDDFAFYRGLFGDLVAWSAASAQVPDPVDRSGTGAYRDLILSNAGSTMVRWALDIRPGNQWLESKITPLAKPKNFRVQIWNRLPLAKPTVKVTAKEIGLTGDAPVLDVQILAPAYRTPAEFELGIAGDAVTLKASHPAKIHLSRTALGDGWTKASSPILTLKKSTGGTAEKVAVAYDGLILEWQAERGEYELKPGSR